MTKTKRQLRAEAVERLRESKPGGYFNVLRDAFGWGHDSRHSDGEWRDALVDLLTDDEPTSSDTWAEYYDESTRTYRIPGELLTDEEPPEGDAPANANFPAENDVRPQDVDANDGKTASTSRQDGGMDTREKLEADVLDWAKHTNAVFIKSRANRIIEFLDRQAAITERECLERATSERVGFDCAECAEGLGKELDARCDPLKARIAELEAERGYWHGQFMGCLTVAIRQENGPNLDKLMTYSPPEADGECWPTAETHVFTEGKASDVCASFLFEGKDKAKRKTVSGMRCWELSHVKAECPHCYHDEVMDIDEFSDDELWYGMPFGVMCSSCGRRFTVEVDDDDR